MEITITYLDETSKVVTLTEDNLVYEYHPGWGELTYVVDVDGYNLIIEPYYDEDIYFIAYYMGAQCDIKDIIFTDEKEIVNVVFDRVSWDGDGMVVSITYADETSETIVMDPIAWDGYMDMDYQDTYCFSKTEKGLLYYNIETYYDASDKPEKYVVYIFEERYEIKLSDAVVGDINGDMEVTSDDVIELLLHVTMPDVFKINADADFNEDGQITSDDVIDLLLHVTMPDVFPLKKK